MILRKPDWLLWFMVAIAAALILTSCYTEKKARKQIDRADTAFPDILPQIARDKYPCTDLLKPDTLTAVHDTVVYIECPEQDPVGYKPTTRTPNDYASVRVDTIRRTVRVPVTLPLQVKYITQWYEDSAKLKLNALALTKSAEEIGALKTELSSMTSKRNWYRKYFLIESGILLLLLLLAIWKIYKRATTIKLR